MTNFAEELKLLQFQMTHKQRLEAMLKELRCQQGPLKDKAEYLKKIKLEEQKDVDRLEGRSLAAFFYYVVGKKDAKLDQERKEAYAARVKYDAAARELEAIEFDIAETELDLADLSDCEDRYRRLLDEMRDSIKAAGGPFSQELLDKEQTLAFLAEQERELREAIDAGREAVSITDAVLASLDSAEDWGTFDLLGGGVLADMAKHEKLDQAQEAVEALQVQLQRFNKELSDVTIRANLQLNIESMLKFADFFFDNLFTDLAVLDRIQQGRSQVEATREKILTTLRQLHDTQESVNHRLEKARWELDDLVLRTAAET